MQFIICKKKLDTVLLFSTILILTFAVSSFFSALPIVDAEASGDAFQSGSYSDSEVTIPFEISRYGEAWNGYLAFGLFDGSASHLIVMDTNGVIHFSRHANAFTYHDVQLIAPEVLMYQGEPLTHTHFWNLRTNEVTDFPNVVGHHEIEYNPKTDTFLTLRWEYLNIDNKTVGFDTIVELDREGRVLWSWNTSKYFNISQACPYCDPGDFTHANTAFWDQDKNIIYLNLRNLDTFCKIDKATGQLLWSCGRYGNFTLLDEDGNTVKSLWAHSHSVKEVEPNVFLMFDNDLHNRENPTSQNSRMIEVTVNEENMTAWISWKWTAPREYWSPIWGDADRLPNGDRLGTFGTTDHYYPNSSGAVLIEVNQNGEMVLQFTFPYGMGIYRTEQINLNIPFYIDGDSQFTIENGVISGNGTLDDPYIIKDWDINASTANGITIVNTSKYFVIRNCVVYGGGDRYSGIRLYNVTNGWIDNVTSWDNGNGIEIDGKSSDNRVSNSNFYDNQYSGVWIFNSSKNTVINCTSYNNSWSAIELYYSNDNSLIDCTLYGNLHAGIWLQGSSNNTILGCTSINNSLSGVELYYDSNDNSLIDCTLHGNLHAGIWLQGSSNNEIINCSIFNNLLSGIEIHLSLSNTISNCELYNTRLGIFVGDSSGCTLMDNLIHDIVIDGVYLDNSSNSVVKDNTIYTNHKNAGIVLFGSFNNIIDNLTAYNNYFGIHLYNSVYNIIMNSTLSRNAEGINLISSSGNTIKDNNASDNAYGLSLQDSSHNVIINNNASNNSFYGIYLWSMAGASGVNLLSFNNTVVNNTASNNDHGIYLWASALNKINNNIATNNKYGVYLFSSFYNQIQNTYSSNNTLGICLSYSTNNVLVNNRVLNNEYRGIDLWSSSNNILLNNKISGNYYNFGVDGFSSSDFINSIDTTNTINGKPVYYWVNKSDTQIPADAGFVGIVNSRNITVKDLVITNNKQGILVAYSTDIKVRNVVTNDNIIGICILGTSIEESNPSMRSVIDAQYRSEIENQRKTSTWSDYVNPISKGEERSFIARENFGAAAADDLMPTITKCRIENVTGSNNYYGIYLWATSLNNLDNNTLTNNKYGISFVISANNILSNTEISNNYYGIQIYSSFNLTIDHCNLNYNYYGLYHDYYSNTEVHYCNIQNNTQGAYNYNSNPVYVVNATFCWWGSPDGPGGVGPGHGDEITFNVLYDPWLSQAVKPPMQNVTISVNTSATSIPHGIPITVYGSLSVPINGTVTLYRGINGTEPWFLTNVSMINGEYSFTYTPLHSGVFVFYALFPGDEQFNPTTSDNVTVDIFQRQNAALYLNASATSIQHGLPLTIYGSLSVPINGTVTLYRGINGTEPWFLTNVSMINGEYSFTYTPLHSGVFVFYALFPGDKDYNPATSENVTVNINGDVFLNPIFRVKGGE